MGCVKVTEEIRKFAESFEQETPETIANALGLWWEANPNRASEMPLVTELGEFIYDMREADKAPSQEPVSASFETQRSATLDELQAVDLVFDPRIRRDRVTLISRLFSNEVDLAMKETQQAITQRLQDDTLTDKQRNDLETQLANLDRFETIKSLTPAGIFKRVWDTFNNYISDTEEGRVQAELNKINAQEQSLIDAGEITEEDRFSDEEKLAAAQRRAAYKNVEYQKLVDHFKPLAEEASGLLIMTEGIRVDPSYVAPADANLNNDTPEGESEVDESSDDLGKDEAFKDGWMTNFRQVSSHESLSQAVRKVIREIPKLDYEGMIEEDDLGNTRYLDADYVHATLIDKLRYMITSEDMMPLLQELTKTKPWVEQISDVLEGDDTLFSQFYQDFRKDYVQYWIQKKINHPDGTFKIETIPVNKPEGVYYLLDQWRDNYESGTPLDTDSVYEKNGEINRENAGKGLALVENLNNQFQRLSTTEERLALLEDEKVWDDIMKALHMIGVDANPAVLRVALTNIKSNEEITFTDPIMLLIPQLNIIFKGIQKGEVKSETLEDGTVKRGDLINTFGSAYNSIAMLLAEVTEDAIESSVRENDKTYYSHVTPSYLGKLVKQLKDVMQNPTKFKQFIDQEFKQYDWFYKDGKWRNDWIAKLSSDPTMRQALQHKVLLNHDKQAYQNWDDLDYTLVLLNEFWAEPKEKMAWYHVPILSDSPSAEFIRFVRYTTGSEIDEEGNRRTYQDIILDKMLDIVNQEYDRIMLVRARDAEFTAGGAVNPIANFDIQRKANGSIKNLGGAQFKFFPELNNLKYENGETFLDRFERLREESPSEFRQFLRDTLSNLMEEGFESTYADWANIGLFDEFTNGKYKYLPFQGQSQTNLRVSKALRDAQAVMGDRFTPEMRVLLDKFANNKAVDDRVAQVVFDQISADINNRVASGTMTVTDANKITKNLTTKNNAKEALREYYWNSKFATSQIIQLTTTDLAFYKDIEDFQKRYKEVHAPSLRLNTHAKFNGETIGRQWERTIYLADDEIVSSTIGDIEQILNAKISQGEMTEVERDYILSQFKNVNVADAQAYRSLSSYRAMMGMMGQWTNEMETAYNHLTKPGETWTMQDFNIIWQTKKPYVYTQINNDSGVEGYSGIKTPVQHKNSEFLLLALHQAIAGPLGKSGKLRAINDFMEKNQVDVVQFESTTKVGKQGVIDLNQVSSYEDTMKVLKETTGIESGNENPNVVHTVSYEDYGIQTATPEHAIDAVQLVGTQIRKLITADIADDAMIDIGGKSMSKADWIKLYNAINTENILQSFIEVDEIFQDPKKVEEILQDEIRGNQRYGADMLRACTLDENGNFNIPLYDPVQSQRVQTLLNSVIKSRITKQKIRGGALIQVSAYGVTDQLKIVYEGEGANKRIKYLECYMPAYSRDFYEPLMNENGTLDVQRLPEDLRKLIGYRVPTEDKYSMVPLYIKGFLPQQNGSAIMLPAEITTLSGSDFDVDKLYIMLPEFRVQKYNIPQALKDFDNENQLMKSLAGMFKPGSLLDDAANDPKFKDWFAMHKQNYLLDRPKVQKIKYDYSKAPHEQTLEARNNALIDMMWGILTNPDTASKILNPGGFNKQKTAARIVTILDSMTEEELKNEGLTPEALLNKSLDDLDALANRYKKKLDPLSPRTQVMLHQQNMTGAKMIGIYANHNANHALMQHTELGVDTENGSFFFAGKKLTSLHGVKNDKGDFISRNNANFLAASVDNVKDNTLHATNQNTLTGDPSMLLSRLGYTPTEIAVLMRQPIVMEITRRYFRNQRDGKSKDSIIDEIIAETAKYAGMYDNIQWGNVKGNSFDLAPMMKDILLYKTVGDMNQNDRVNFYRRQVAAGLLFQRVMKTADALGKLVSATRADTQGGAAGPTIADTIIKLQKVEDFLNDVYGNPKFPLVGADVISDNIRFTGNEEELRQQLLDSPLPFLQAFYSLGVRQTEKMLGRYFPQFSQSFREVLDGKYNEQGDLVFEGLRQMTKSGRLNVKTINSIYNDLLAYIMSGTEFFGDGMSRSGKRVSAAEKRRDFINNFPEYFQRTVAENEDIADLEFIKRLKTARSNDRNPVSVVVFKNVGQLSPTLRDRYMRDWTTLMYMDNPKAQELALNMFLYSYYRNGFAFGPSTFIHLAPVSVRNAVPGYIEKLRDIMNNQDSFQEFINQYIYNHLDNRKLVPEIPTTSNTEFTDENGKFFDEVVITIDGNATVGDRAAVKEETREGGVTTYDFFNFIGRKSHGKWGYYRLSGIDDNSAIYTRIEPLGYKNSFLEYEYGKEAEEIATVIDKNRKDYDPFAEYAAQFEDNGLSEEALASMPVTSAEELDSLAASMAYSQIYGRQAEGFIDSSRDMTSLQPNTEFRDANDDQICGGPSGIVIAEL